MGFKTTADEKLDKAKENIKDAIENLSEILIHECYGWEEYTSDYQLKLDNAFNALRKIKADLK